MIPVIRSPTGAEMPILGQGTWRMGESASRREAEIAALRLGFDLGMTLVDTAEMYADGEAERVVGEALAGRREEVFVVSKVLPQNASLRGTSEAAERSLKRLCTDRLDLYLLHWPGSHPLAETLEAFEHLTAQGKILHYGVSNFDLDEMRRTERLRGGDKVAANQLLYNLERRGIERRLLPWCAERGIVVMAYSPFEEGRLRKKAALVEVARRHGVGPECVALAWTLRAGVVALPKATRLEHVRENAAAAALRLTPEDLAALDLDYPAPEHEVPLETS